MYQPDPSIVKKIKEYSPHLFVEWNNRKQYWEIWYRAAVGRRLITPVTQSLYDPKKGKKIYTDLDERILQVLSQSDGEKIDRHWYRKQEQKEKELERQKLEQARRNYKDFAMDAYAATHHWFSTKHAAKNSGKPNFNKAKQSNQWIKPDVQSLSRPRLFQRSAANAQAYGYRK